MLQRPEKTDVLSHWHHLIENFNTSPQEFYSILEKTIQKRQIPELKSTGITQEKNPIGLRRSPQSRNGADSKCDCADCSDQDCGPNNPC